MKLLLSLVLTFALALVIVDARLVDPSIKINCIIQHLKASKMLEENYPRHPGLSTADCAEIIEKVTQSTFEGVYSGLRSNNLGKSVQCVVSGLRASKWPEIIFLNDVYSSSDNLTPDEKATKTQEVLAKIEEVAKATYGPCVFNDLFSGLFDKIVNKSFDSNEEDDPVTKYCIRKHVVDNQLIDSSYTVVLNPDNVDISTANCLGHIEEKTKKSEKSLLGQFSAQLSGEGSKACAKEKIKQLGLVNKVFALIVLGETQFSVEQRQAEKQKFVGLMTDAVFEVRKCN